MSNNNEQFDLMHDVLGHILQKSEQIQTDLNRIAELKQQSYTAEFDRLNSQALATEHGINTLEEKINRLGNLLADRAANSWQTPPQKHHHHFDLKSKGFLIGAAILLAVTAICAGLSLSLWSENRLLHENDLKYRMVRQISPTVAHWTDSLYHKDPEGAEVTTRKLESAQQTNAAEKVENMNAAKQNRKSK